MAKPRVKAPQELTRKEIAINRRQKEQSRRVLIGTGAVILIVLLVIAAGLIDQFLIKPTSPVARVEGVPIQTRDYQRRVQLQRYNLQRQIDQYQQLDAQFGSADGQSLFAAQISQLEALLNAPETLGRQVLDRMIEEEVIRQTAAQRGIVVTAEEVEAELQSQVATFQGYVAEHDATATAEARAQATATAAAWTPTPTLTASLALTDTMTPTPAPVEPTPTPQPTPTVHIMTTAEYATGQQSFAALLQQIAEMPLEQYRGMIEVQLLEEKLQEVVNRDVPTTEEQVHARHILIAIRTPLPTPTPAPTSAPLDSAEPTPTPIPTPEPRTEEQALALANTLVARLRAGEDFAALAAEFSDDPGSKDNGGDLGWFGRGRMVPEFEAAAFSQEPGQIGDPVKTTYGYHIIQVLAKDSAHPIDEGTLRQRQAEAYRKLLDEQKATLKVEEFWSVDKLPPTATPQFFPQG